MLACHRNRRWSDRQGNLARRRRPSLQSRARQKTKTMPRKTMLKLSCMREKRLPRAATDGKAHGPTCQLEDITNHLPLKERYSWLKCTGVKKGDHPRCQPDKQQQDWSTDGEAKLGLVIHEPDRRNLVVDDLCQAGVVVRTHRTKQKAHISHCDAPRCCEIPSCVKPQFLRYTAAHKQQRRRVASPPA